MLERKEVLDDFCFCLDLGQCLPFTAGMCTGWFQIYFGRLMWASCKSATVGPQETLGVGYHVKKHMSLYQEILMLNNAAMEILLHWQPQPCQTMFTVRTTARGSSFPQFLQQAFTPNKKGSSREFQVKIQEPLLFPEMT